MRLTKRSASFRIFVLAIALSGLSASASGQEGIADRPEVRAFIREISGKHRLSGEALNRLFRQVVIQDKILEAIARPAEAKPWHAYRKIFLTEARIQGGLTFWDRNGAALSKARIRFGVPPEMIVAILGIETGYGQNTGNYRVVDALSTLAFDYPKRAEFFRHELEDFLLLCREEGIDPALPKGSYAGAMGMPQFMPSSYRHYAADLDGDQRRDIWGNPADAIASVANYFSVHGWQSGEPVAFPASVRGDGFFRLLGNDLKPSHRIVELRKLGVEARTPLPDQTRATLLELGEEEGPAYWLALHNFYVISRYNHSPLYAMAAYQLSRELLARRGT
ncbi:MAG TPA: lytic murein transglycosylase B [Methylococcaceae bacterium]|nr:lytic murein transglycosylase B [Methylococcaceae bacterium]